MLTYQNCTLCPRRCGVDRTDPTTLGFCGGSATPHIARAGLHFGEEPPISGTRGSGAVFFAGCTLRCPFCQNHRISRDADAGRAVTAADLAAIFLDLVARGAHNLNLVTPTHHWPTVVEALDAVKPRLGVPVIANCGGYESTETVAALAGYVDVWLPDLKYGTPDFAASCSAPADYPAVNLAAIAQMVAQTGPVAFDDAGMVTRGVIVRHLVLPGGRRDSIAAIEGLRRAVDPAAVRLSLMRQYTPPAGVALPRSLSRTVTSFEYESVLAAAAGFEGFAQSREAVGEGFVPEWDWA